MNQIQARQKLNDELRTYIGLQSDAEREAFWEQLKQEAAQRSENEKAAIRHAISDDVEAIRKRVMNLKNRIQKVAKQV